MVALDILRAILVPVWTMFTENEVPGLGISFAEWFIALMVIGVVIQLIRFGFGFGGGSSYRSGDSRRKYISDERKGDQR